MTDLEIQLLIKKADKYAGLTGALPAEGCYVHRFNGFFQGYVEARGEQMTEAAKAKLIKEPEHVPAKLNFKPEGTVAIIEADLGFTMADFL